MGAHRLLEEHHDRLMEGHEATKGGIVKATWP